MIIRWLLYSILTLVLTILAYPIVPIAVLLADKETGRLPKFLRWFETHDDLGWGAGTYEEPIGKAYAKYGKRIALILWLWRNKAYTFRNKIRVDSDYSVMTLSHGGSEVPPKYGFYREYITMYDGMTKKKWFDLFLGCSFGKFHMYFRLGWKLKPIWKDRKKPDGKSATGMFSGISIRSDDWDDYPAEQRPV